MGARQRWRMQQTRLCEYLRKYAVSVKANGGGIQIRQSLGHRNLQLGAWSLWPHCWPTGLWEGRRVPVKPEKDISAGCSAGL